MVAEEDLGWCVDPQNADDLVAAVRSIAADAERVRNMQSAARGVAEGKYTAEHALEKFRGVFAKLARS
jgi:glycosyltransferase involved in cell wall biosynthesis